MKDLFARFFKKSGHRICRKCKKQIRKRHRWHQVRVGWFSPWYTCEHWNCNNPTADPNVTPTLPEEVLPFESAESVMNEP